MVFELIIYLYAIFCKIIKPASADKTPSIIKTPFVQNLIRKGYIQ